MKIVRIVIKNFRCIRSAELFPSIHNVLLGPNNVGKTTVLEALNLVLNPEITFRSNVIDENDFYRRQYRSVTVAPVEDGAEGGTDDATSHEATDESVEQQLPQADVTTALCAAGQDPFNIYIEVVLSELCNEDKDKFGDNLVPWDSDAKTVIEGTEEGTDPFEHASPAIRVFFEGWYDPEEDDFYYDTFFLPTLGLNRNECHKLSRVQKQYIGFLIYRNFRGLTRPITLEPQTLFGLLLRSQKVQPKNFERVLGNIDDALEPMSSEADFGSIVSSYKAELERFLPLCYGSSSNIAFELTDRTRRQLKAIGQLYVDSESKLPIEKMGAGTRSIAILAMLTLIMRRRERGILALEEPETFLFPHAQRRLMDECIDLSDQVFVTTHSPYVLERIPVSGVGRVVRDPEDHLSWSHISVDSVRDINLYSKRLKQVHCEALVGRAVLIVEGDSDRVWVMGVSRILNRQVWHGNRQEAFDLQGIGVVSAEGHGEISKLGKFFYEAGLKVVGLYDKTSEQNAVEDLCRNPWPSIFLPHEGLEELLASELPISVLVRFIVEAQHCKTALKTANEVSSMNDGQIRIFAKETLIANKGSIQMHEWLISTIDPNACPEVLKNLVYEVSGFARDEIEFCTHSLCT